MHNAIAYIFCDCSQILLKWVRAKKVRPHIHGKSAENLLLSVVVSFADSAYCHLKYMRITKVLHMFSHFRINKFSQEIFNPIQTVCAV